MRRANDHGHEYVPRGDKVRTAGLTRTRHAVASHGQALAGCDKSSGTPVPLEERRLDSREGLTAPPGKRRTPEHVV